MRSDHAWSPRQQGTPSTALLASLLRLDLSRGTCGGNAQREWDSCTAGIPESPHRCPQVPKGEDGLCHTHWSHCQLELTRVNSQPPRKWRPSAHLGPVSQTLISHSRTFMFYVTLMKYRISIPTSERLRGTGSGSREQVETAEPGMNVNICPEAHHLPDGGAKARPEM